MILYSRRGRIKGFLPDALENLNIMESSNDCPPHATRVSCSQESLVCKNYSTVTKRVYSTCRYVILSAIRFIVFVCKYLHSVKIKEQTYPVGGLMRSKKALEGIKKNGLSCDYNNNIITCFEIY